MLLQVILSYLMILVIVFFITEDFIVAASWPISTFRFVFSSIYNIFKNGIRFSSNKNEMAFVGIFVFFSILIFLVNLDFAIYYVLISLIIYSVTKNTVKSLSWPICIVIFIYNKIKTRMRLKKSPVSH